MSNDTHGFSGRDVKRIGRAVRAHERNAPLVGGKPRPRGADTPAFWVELTEEGTGASGGKYKWKKVTPDAGGLVDTASPLISSGADFTARDINDTKGIAAGTRVEVRFVGYDGDGKACYLFDVGGPGGIFVVNLAQSGGAEGTQTTAATYTYNVTSESGVALSASPMAPERPRIRKGRVTAATQGYGRFKGDGTFALVEAWEVFGSAGCA